MEITLTKEQEDAIIAEYGTVDYLQTYCVALANWMIVKHPIDLKAAELIAAKAKYEAYKVLTKEDQAKVDVILSTAAVAVDPGLVEEPIGG